MFSSRYFERRLLSATAFLGALALSCSEDSSVANPVPATAGAGGGAIVNPGAGSPGTSGTAGVPAAAGTGGANTSAGTSSGGMTGTSGAGGSMPAAGSAGTGGAGIGVDCATDPERIYQDIEYLASDELRGRIPGDVGNELALEHAEAEFMAAGLSPGGNDGTYRQAFPFSCNNSWCENHRNGTAENVLGKLEGTDPELGDEVILVGAHIDHLGYGDGEGIYGGADDNASGAAIVMELSRMFAKCGLQPKRTVVFVQWNAEEMGLIGSRYYVQNPILPLEDTIAVYNFDMVGGGDGSGVLLFGGDDDENRWLTNLMVNAADEQGLEHVIELVPQKLASDHAPFVQRGIPICWGFSRPDPHPGYHTPDDDMSRIRLQSLRAVSELFWAALRPLAMGDEGELIERRESARVLYGPAIELPPHAGGHSCGAHP